jgi:peptide/nickel transport system substrate-binding protein
VLSSSLPYLLPPSLQNKKLHMRRFFLLWYWFIIGFLKKHLRTLVIGSLGGIATVILGTRIFSTINIKPTYYVGRVGGYTLSQLPLDIQQKLSFGLTSIKADGSFEYAAAQSMTVSDDGTTYTFTLNPQVMWPQLDQKLSSNDIVLSIQDVQIERPQPESIVFKLNEPFAPFPNIVSQPILKKTELNWPLKKTIIDGLNHYRVTKVQTTSSSITSLRLEGDSDNIVYRFYPTEKDALIAFKLGRVDRLEHMTDTYIDQWPHVKVIKNELPDRYIGLFFNTSNASLGEKTIRQLLTYATPKDDSKNRVVSPISKTSWAYNPQVKTYTYDPKTAEGMLEGLKTANPNFTLNLELTTTPTYAKLAQQIIESWSKLGIETQLKIVAYPDTNNYQILLIGQEIPADPDQYGLWYSTQTTNITKYQNAKIDKLLIDGRKEHNQQKRKEIYLDFQRFLVEDCPAAFLYQLSTYSITRQSED